MDRGLVTKKWPCWLVTGLLRSGCSGGRGLFSVYCQVCPARCVCGGDLHSLPGKGCRAPGSRPAWGWVTAAGMWWPRPASRVPRVQMEMLPETGCLRNTCGFTSKQPSSRALWEVRVVLSQERLGGAVEAELNCGP